MKERKSILIAAIVLCLFNGCSKSSQTDNNNNPNNNNGNNTNPVDTSTTGVKAVTKNNKQKVYVHYMAWFETPQTSPDGKWGSHWTMANKDPNTTLTNGRRQIASWFYPMIGPYASSDRDVIDYHLLLMKYSGIDGVIVDWYGVHNVNNYPLVKRNTDSLFKRVPNAGLQFGVCYEDATLGQDKAVAGLDTVTAAQQDFAY